VAARGEHTGGRRSSSLGLAQRGSSEGLHGTDDVDWPQLLSLFRETFTHEIARPAASVSTGGGPSALPALLRAARGYFTVYVVGVLQSAAPVFVTVR
jgi:hypothetical protein